MNFVSVMLGSDPTGFTSTLLATVATGLTCLVCFWFFLENSVGGHLVRTDLKFPRAGLRHVDP